MTTQRSRPRSQTTDLPLVTVVTVVYNGEEHLAECIESIVRQTYTNWEYVIVDNCSSDRTPEIAERFARSDTRIRHERHEEFVAVVESHNRGFRTLGPESAYCKFVGADDWLYPECLAAMVGLSEREPGVGVVGSYRLNGSRVDLVGLPYWQSTEPGRDTVARGLLSPFAVTGSPTALLLRSELVRARMPFYDESFRHADAEAGYWALMRSDYGLVHQVLTYNREAVSPETRLSDRLSSYLPERLRMLIRYGPDLLSPADYERALRERFRAYIAEHRRWFIWRHSKGYLKRASCNEEFIAFHRHAIELMAAEAGDDPQVRRAVSILRLLLR